MKRIAFSCIAIVILAIAALWLVGWGMDWEEADRAEPMTLTLTDVAMADCSTFTALRVQASHNGACRLTGYVLSAPFPSAGKACTDGKAWGVSEARHGKGQRALFCTSQIQSFEPVGG